MDQESLRKLFHELRSSTKSQVKFNITGLHCGSKTWKQPPRELQNKISLMELIKPPQEWNHHQSLVSHKKEGNSFPLVEESFP